MDTVKLKDLISLELENNKPNIVTCADLEKVFSCRPSVAVELLESLCAETHDNPDTGRLRKIFFISGYKLSPAASQLKIFVHYLVNEEDKNKIEAEILSPCKCMLYGVYKGNYLDPFKLRVCPFDGHVNELYIKIPTDYLPDGNCVLSSSGRSDVPMKKQEDHPVKQPQMSTSAPVSKPVPSKNLSTDKPAQPATSTNAKAEQNTKQKPKDSQAKLFFQSTKPKEVHDKESPSTIHIAVKQSDVNVGKAEASTPESATQSHADSNSAKAKSKGLDNKENDLSESKKESVSNKTKRSRVTVFSSDSESEEEIATTSKSKKQASAPDVSKQEVSKGKSSATVNRTGLKLDLEDIQNESDGESAEESHREAAVVVKPKRRKRTQSSEDTDSIEQNGEKNKSKKAKPNFGSVKAGDFCSSQKFVDKSFLDDEGFLVTEKVLEESRKPDKNTIKTEPKPPAIKTEPSSKPVPSKPVKALPKQQMSLASFFKK